MKRKVGRRRIVRRRKEDSEEERRRRKVDSEEERRIPGHCVPGVVCMPSQAPLQELHCLMVPWYSLTHSLTRSLMSPGKTKHG